MRGTRVVRMLVCSAVCAGLAALDLWGARAQPGAERGFTTSLAERSIEAYSRQFGPGTRERLDAWKRFAAEHKGAGMSEPDLLRDVNRALNRIRFVDDASHWGEEDYWATPAESVGSNGGDCEDFSIAKYFMLKELGVPISKL